MTDETHSHFFIDIDEDSLPAGPLADIFDQLTEALVKDALSKACPTKRPAMLLLNS